MNRRVAMLVGGACASAVLLAVPLIGFAQFGRSAPTYEANVPYDGRYTYARIRYAPPDFGGGFAGFRRDVKWDHDYPRSDRHFPKIIEEITTIKTRTAASDIFTLDDPELMKFPVAYLCEAGYWRPTDAEVQGLRNYLLKGGFLYVDDFWGSLAWEQWSYEIARVLPPHKYPIVEIPRDHAIMHTLYDVKEVPQVPSINRWYQMDGGTSERGADSPYVNFRGIQDEHGRLMVVMTHNTDISDTWEREGENKEYFDRFSPDGYAVGVNIILYALTH